jgi:hypothetical protein
MTYLRMLLQHRYGEQSRISRTIRTGARANIRLAHPEQEFNYSLLFSA